MGVVIESATGEGTTMLTRSRSPGATDSGDLLRGRFDLSVSPLFEVWALDALDPSVLEVSSEPKSEKDRFR